MTILTEKNHAAEFLHSEGEGHISREAVIVGAGAALDAGQVLGIVTATGKYAPYNNAASDGTEVAAGILYSGLPASAGDRKAVAIVRLAEVLEARLIGLDANGKADLKTHFVIVR